VDNKFHTNESIIKSTILCDVWNLDEFHIVEMTLDRTRGFDSFDLILASKRDADFISRLKSVYENAETKMSRATCYL
jgi:hypothetical protein